MVGVLWFAFIGLISTISIAITSGAYNANNSDPSTIAAKLGLGVIALLVIVLTSMTANAVNLLGAGSALSNIFPKLNLKLALWIVVILATVVTLIPMFVGSFLDTFESFLDYVAMVLGPTIAIICTDFYWKAKRHYQVEEFGRVKGRYWYKGGVNPAAIITFVVGVVIFLACQKQTFFVNTVGDHLYRHGSLQPLVHGPVKITKELIMLIKTSTLTTNPNSLTSRLPTASLPLLKPG